jgi:hypothetical protein
MKYVVLGVCTATLMSASLLVPAANAASVPPDWITEAPRARAQSSPAPPSVNATITTSEYALGANVSLSGIFNFGSGGGGSAQSGGAPSPEVNAALGFLLAGSTVAFLRRRRTRDAGSHG